MASIGTPRDSVLTAKIEGRRQGPRESRLYWLLVALFLLLATAMSPLAIEAGQTDGLSHHLLIHPETVTADGALTVFAAVAPGTRLYAMRGERRNLIDRAGRVVSEAQAMPTPIIPKIKKYGFVANIVEINPNPPSARQIACTNFRLRLFAIHGRANAIRKHTTL